MTEHIDTTQQTPRPSRSSAPTGLVFFIARRLLGFISLWACALPYSSAQTPTTPNPPVLAADGLPFGRLFNTPEARLGWDRNREQKNTQPGAEYAGAPQANPNRSTRLSGVILRDDGQQTLWINGQLQHQTHRAPKHTVLGGRQQSQTLHVRIGTAGKALKPGQVWQAGERRAQEGYQAPLARPASAAPITESIAEPIAQPAPPAAAIIPEVPKPAAPATNLPPKEPSSGR